MKGTPRRVEKPWGYELIWAEADEYVGKILQINAGEALSLQYHEVKEETLYLLAGTMRFLRRPIDRRAGGGRADREVTASMWRRAPSTGWSPSRTSRCSRLRPRTWTTSFGSRIATAELRTNPSDVQRSHNATEGRNRMQGIVWLCAALLLAGCGGGAPARRSARWFGSPGHPWWCRPTRSFGRWSRSVLPRLAERAGLPLRATGAG